MFKKFTFNGKVLYSVKECLNVFINLLILDFISIPFFISGPNNSKKLLSDGSSLKTLSMQVGIPSHQTLSNLMILHLDELSK